MKPRHVVEMIKREHGIDVTRAQVNGWRTTAKALQREASVAAQHVPETPIVPQHGSRPAPLVDGCMMSYRLQRSGMKEAAGPFTCALSINIMCNGCIECKKKCPLWSGSAKIF